MTTELGRPRDKRIDSAVMRSTVELLAETGYADLSVDAIARRQAVGGESLVRLGDCWKDAESYYFDHEHLDTIKPSEDWYPASIFFQGMKFMLYGDPSIPVP